MRSRKKIAEQFQDWVCEVVEEIRKKGKYDLQEQLKQKEIEYQQKQLGYQFLILLIIKNALLYI